MTDLVFFYGTLMSGFKRQGRARIDLALAPVGHGSIQGALFDLGIYPAAIPALDGRVRGFGQRRAVVRSSERDDVASGRRPAVLSDRARVPCRTYDQAAHRVPDQDEFSHSHRPSHDK